MPQELDLSLQQTSVRAWDEHLDEGPRGSNSNLERDRRIARRERLAARQPAEAQRHAFLGERQYLAGQYREAKRSFSAAVQSDLRNPLYLTFLAMTLYQLKEMSHAESTMARAIRLEKRYPIANRGQRLTRYQGPVRLWLEQRRRNIRSSD